LRLRGNLLKKNREFVQVYQRGKVATGRYCVLYFLPNQDNNTRVGISVSKKVGNSVVRHRLKRLYKEAFRLNCHKIKPGFDLVAIVRKKAFDIGFEQCQADFMNTLKKAGIILQDKEQG
jgi:ribonuclease P protein component